MQAHKLIVTVFSLGAAFALGTPAISADLPKEGTIKIHSNANLNNQSVDVGEKHFMTSGNSWGVTYNDAGSGPLHMGAWFCDWTFHNVIDPIPIGGACAFGDAEGMDKIYIPWTGTLGESGTGQGTGTIIGGIGKYNGIQGKMTWQCKMIDPAHGLNGCTQQFDYQLTPVSATK
jgi:hypothetical protein